MCGICAILGTMGSGHGVSARRPRNSLSRLGRQCIVLYLWDMDWIEAIQNSVKSWGLCTRLEAVSTWITLTVRICAFSSKILHCVSNHVDSTVLLLCWLTCRLHVELLQPLGRFSCCWSCNNPFFLSLSLSLCFSLSHYRRHFVVIYEKGRWLWWVGRRCG